MEIHGTAMNFGCGVYLVVVVLVIRTLQNIEVQISSHLGPSVNDAIDGLLLLESAILKVQSGENDPCKA